MKVLIFVYNSNSGLYHTIKNNLRRFISSPKYICKLQKLIYGKVFMRREWRNFLGDLSYNKVFFHKKEFKRAHPEFAYLELPSILIKSNDKISVLITAQEINAMENIDDLIGVLGKKLSEM
jgi:hypothetical protein